MKRFWMFFLTLFLLAACGSKSSSTPTPTPGFPAICGDGVCESSESAVSCPQDCPAEDVRTRSVVVYITAEGIGKIAILVSYPETTRYPEGAGVVVIASPFYSDPGGFMTDPSLTSLGLIQLSYLWPGQTDQESGALSEGDFDYGGPKSLQVLRDVIKFAAGRKADTEGRFIFATVPVTPLTGEVGLYAYGGAGMAAVNVLASYPDELQGLQYYIARETPTIDTLAGLEAGYRNDSGQPVPNPIYLSKEDYSPQAITIPYTNLHWDPAYVDSHTGAVGAAYLDLDGSGSITDGDYVFGWKAPVMFGKRYYSIALSQALAASGALTADNWPADLATPQEAEREWSLRNNNQDRFMAIQSAASLLIDLKIMLVFADLDTAQAAPDKPHIHQLFQGFRFVSRLWVRLNPDRAYVQFLVPSAGMDFPDNPVNTQPDDWNKIGNYAYPSQGTAARLVPLAAAAEMADRTHYGRWDENLGQTLYVYFPPTAQP